MTDLLPGPGAELHLADAVAGIPATGFFTAEQFRRQFMPKWPAKEVRRALRTLVEEGCLQTYITADGARPMRVYRRRVKA